MTFPTDQEEFSGVCPYLGLADDADSHATFPTEAHRCYRLPNPTRIASTHQDTYCLAENHVNCPVYLGEGVPGTARQAAAAVPAAQPPRGRAPQTVRGPQAGANVPPAGGARPRPAAAGPAGSQGSFQRPRKPRDAGSIGPRPRSGGVSMPVATIGLFALAVVVIGIAFLINNLVGGSSNSLSPQDQFATNQALTTNAGGAATTPGSTRTPGATQATGTAATGTGTPGAGGSATVAGGGAGTYTVQSGDTCSGIASANGITLAQLEQLNGLTDDTCPQIAIGQVLKLK
ncbi:MAG: LysM peptidoglycan-binding domain-containing protein [Tepidiformaceae bacterium]